MCEGAALVNYGSVFPRYSIILVGILGALGTPLTSTIIISEMIPQNIYSLHILSKSNHTISVISLMKDVTIIMQWYQFRGSRISRCRKL